MNFFCALALRHLAKSLYRTQKLFTNIAVDAVVAGAVAVIVGEVSLAEIRHVEFSQLCSAIHPFMLAR